MKIILSRKGFDSGSGGVANPILPSGHLCMLPIPDSRSTISYRDIQIPASTSSRLKEVNLGWLLNQLTGERILPQAGAHLDPDLFFGSVKRRGKWRALFGQCGSALGHLRRQGVEVGDLFLFYGWFRQTDWLEGKLRYAAGAPDLHVIFGWLQIGEIWDLTHNAQIPLWAQYHPHCQETFRQSVARRPNVLYVSRRVLEIPASKNRYPGAGLFPKFHGRLQLSEGGSLRSLWRLPTWFAPSDGRPPLTYHAAPSRWQCTPQGVRLRTVGRGQEFVLDGAAYPESARWLHTLFEETLQASH